MKPPSKQINDSKFYAQFKRPAYDYRELCTLLEHNTYHKDCCEVVAEDASAYSWNIVPVADLNKDPDETEKERIVDWISSFSVDINKLLFEVNYDRRSMGSSAIELIRESVSTSQVVDFQRMDIFDTLKHRDKCRILQERNGERKWFIE